MYAFIKGYIDKVLNNKLYIDCNMVGYELNVSNNTIGKLQDVKDVVKIYTYLNVREDEMTLYGFYNLEEKELFMYLTSVSGVGCKLALTILSGLSLNNLKLAISQGDIKSLSNIKGVGKKTAERIVVELKDKLSDSCEEISFTQDNSIMSDNHNDAINVLISLGFNKTEATAAVIRASKQTSDIDKIIELAIKNSIRK